MARIRVIEENGEIKIEVEGVKGSSCLKLTKELERKLGLVKSRKKKKEFFEQEQTQTTRQEIKL